MRTPRLELRWPSRADLDALAELSMAGVHDPQTQPFVVPWTDLPPRDRARGVLQYHWRTWASWKPDDWRLDLVVVLDGTVVGSQGMGSRDFAVRREVSTASWLGLAYHGRGIGTEMRAAVLSLAFAGLAADCAVTSAFAGNEASRRVSRKLGYRDDGVDLFEVRGRRVAAHRMRLDRAAWEAARSVPVDIIGLEPCLPQFGLA